MSSSSRDLSPDTSALRPQVAQSPGAPTRFKDNFSGDDASLLLAAETLLELDAHNALAPHGIGGLARALIGALAARLDVAAAARSAVTADASRDDQTQQQSLLGDAA
jgi:hypothetical protein